MILYWLDVETTGLDPQYNTLLEIAIVATKFNDRFDEIGEPVSTVFRYPVNLSFDQVHPDVLTMHAANGLWKESKAAAFSAGNLAAWDEILERIKSWGLEDEEGMLAGRSVHFDLQWLKAYAPDSVVDALNLSHRLFDLTAIKRFTELCGVPENVDYESDHRALGDVQDDIKLARTLVWDLGEAYFRYQSVSK